MPLHVAKDPIVNAALASAAIETGLPLDVLHAVAWVESRFDPRATSPVGARGLMQLMPGTALGLGVTQPYNPVQNASGGARFLKGLYLKYGGDLSKAAEPSFPWEQALAAYNWGPGNVQHRPHPSQWPAQVRGYVINVWRAAGWPVPFEVKQKTMTPGEIHDRVMAVRSSQRRS